jgi:glucose-6-phosphate dehydrogenase assembly protein OpcA
LPTTVWCPEDVSRHPPQRAIVAEARQLIYDSRVWSDVPAGVRAIEQSIHGFRVDVADVNWRRLAPVRDAVRHSMHQLPIDALRSGRVRIAHAPGEASMAWLLAGWLAARLGWSGIAARVEETHDSDARLTLTIGAGVEATTVELRDRQVRVAPGGAPPYVSAARQESPADAIAAELQILVADVALRDALRALARLSSPGSF